MSFVPTTVGDLSAHSIGRDRIVVRHEGSTVSGVLNDLQIETEAISETAVCGSARTYLVSVKVTVTVGSITVGPLHRDHECEVLA